MTLSARELEELAVEATRAARAAGAIIASARPRTQERKSSGGSDASTIVTDVDRRAQEVILRALAGSVERFGLAVLSEERPDDGRRLHAPAFWSIDPLDGTLPYVEDAPGYAVSIALVSRDGAPLLGVVFDPRGGVLHRAITGGGRTREPALVATPGDRLTVFVDRSFEALADRDAVLAVLDAIARERGLDGIEHRVGAGAVMNACGVLEAPPACYVKRPKAGQGGGSLWDVAATACIAAEAGAVATDLAGDPLDLNRADSTFLNHRGVLFATDADLATAIRARLPPRADAP